VLAESKNSINISQIENQDTNQFNKIQENYMKSLEYNYQRMYILRDAKIFQLKLAIKRIQRFWRNFSLTRKIRACLTIQT
jgi:hypothetical protein